MGNIFFTNNTREIYHKCYKCNDTFKNHCAGHSERTSCRIHNIDETTNICKDCHEIYNTTKNCYHINSKPNSGFSFTC
jgi:hypothetical protein